MQCCAGQMVVGGDAIGVDGLYVMVTAADDDDVVVVAAAAVNRSILKDWCCCCIRGLGSGGVGNGTSLGGGDAVEGRKGADTPGA